MKKILVLLGFLLTSLVSFNCLDAMNLSSEDLSDQEINQQIDGLRKQLSRAIKNDGKDSARAQELFAQRASLEAILAKRYLQSQIDICIFNIKSNNLKHSDLDDSSEQYKNLSEIGVFKQKAADSLVSSTIKKFLEQEKENLEISSLRCLLENMKALKPKEKIPAPTPKPIADKKAAPAPQAKNKDDEKNDDDEKVEKSSEGTKKDTDQTALLPVLMSPQVKDWKDGALQQDQESAKLLSQILLDLREGRDRGTMLTTQYSQRFFDVHIGKRQRLYFAYEPVGGKRTLLLLYGGPKKDQEADIKSAHAQHLLFLHGEKSKQKPDEKNKKKK